MSYPDLSLIRQWVSSRKLHCNTIILSRLIHIRGMT